MQAVTVTFCQSPNRE